MNSKLPSLSLFAKNIYISINKMFSWISHRKIIYVLSNLIVIPARVIPTFDLIANIYFFALLIAVDCDEDEFFDAFLKKDTVIHDRIKNKY